MTKQEARTVFKILRLVGSDNENEAQIAAKAFARRITIAQCDYVDMAEHLTREERSECLTLMLMVASIMKPGVNLKAEVMAIIDTMTVEDIKRAVSLET